MGIVVPHVNDRAAAERAMKSAKYAPLGYRGMYGGRQSYGVPDYVRRANDQTLVVVLLEELEALQKLDEILRVDNIDVFFVAPSDLAQTMGHIGDTNHPEVQKAIDDAIARIVAAGRVAGTLVNEDNLSSYVRKGARFLMTSWNGWVARSGAEFLRRVSAASR
jgi:4-hydroxy-2-oxoheptanedioate aldolase